MSLFGTFRTWLEVRVESAMRTKADSSCRHLEFMGFTPCMDSMYDALLPRHCRTIRASTGRRGPLVLIRNGLTSIEAMRVPRVPPSGLDRAEPGLCYQAMGLKCERGCGDSLQLHAGAPGQAVNCLASGRVQRRRRPSETLSSISNNRRRRLPNNTPAPFRTERGADDSSGSALNWA